MLFFCYSMVKVFSISLHDQFIYSFLRYNQFICINSVFSLLRGRMPEWYHKNFGHVCALHVSNILASFKQNASGPESKV